MAALIVPSLKKQANKIVYFQCVFVLILVVIFFVITGPKAGFAALCGGLVYIGPGYLYAARLFSNVSARAIVRIMCVFYVGEVLKLMISIGLFIVLLRVFTFPLLPYFLGYLVAALAFCIAPFWLMNKKTVNTV